MVGGQPKRPSAFDSGYLYGSSYEAFELPAGLDL